MPGVIRTEAAVSEVELEVRVVEGLVPAGPAEALPALEDPQRERDAEAYRQQRRYRVSCNRPAYLLHDAATLRIISHFARANLRPNCTRAHGSAFFRSSTLGIG